MSAVQEDFLSDYSCIMLNDYYEVLVPRDRADTAIAYNVLRLLEEQHPQQARHLRDFL